MHSVDPYGDHDDEHVDMPRLPIARPGESHQTAPPGSVDTGVAPRPLGGGASYTSVDPDAPDQSGDVGAAAGGAQVGDVEAMTWDVAARLTSGMLANPARAHASVKDAMALFDQFLNEMHAYVRIADASGMMSSNAARRKAHGEYFRGAQEAAAEEASSTQVRPTIGPSQGAGKPVPGKPAPAKPRPSGDYRPIPPGLRGPYSPGSMAGSPPPDDDAGSDPVRRRPAA
ncbi:MAG: hypothetical protein KDC46_05265 [Thermoleophilia bacterium]|nr:hypothetical protein [Thermoleophilia bacterium]